MTTLLDMPLGDRLRELRREKGLTQQQLAEKARVTLSIITKLERGANSDPRWSTVQALADALQCSLDDLRDRPAGGERLPGGGSGEGEGEGEADRKV